MFKNIALAALNSTLGATMRGVMFDGKPFSISVQDLPMPHIELPTDAIVKITTSAICGSDLHAYRGYSAATTPYNIGHEAIGYITEIGSNITSLQVGEYVIVPDTSAHAHIPLTPEPLTYYGNGPVLSPGLGGLQSEYVRVPFAEGNLIPIPLNKTTTNATLEQSYVTVSDIWSTAWTGLDFSGFEPGDTVAVFGAGPVGLLTAYTAILRGASRVYSVDHVPMRLERAASIGAVAINFVQSDPVAQILAYEPSGVVRSVDCVGLEALNSTLQVETNIILNQMVNVTRIGGGIGQLGIYGIQPGAPAIVNDSSLIHDPTFPMSLFFGKGLRMQSGLVDARTVAPRLIELIASGKADPSFIHSATINIEQAPEYYRRFNLSQELKVFISFP
ncbi:S-(hydroxymethyl)glutathione dehydrogenase [Fusarium oxysporum f. sp. cubense]|uniref:S-(Hydroxymethyl)glutathione dehydrogenase n=1 Tax=Fusarium oxysporum f. sp. cubense TaxID=61366 RepID=A0A559KKN2_FUSOC|nr:S-(hydroxymethyl)glutathione dehydrogenase [Fusarium oxysporum f. sp. cubense]